MSIENITMRMAEIEARLQALAPEPDQFSILDSRFSMAQSKIQNPKSKLGLAQPFDVALAQAAGRASLRPTSGGFSPEIESLIEKYSAQNGLSPALVRAVITAESGGDPTSRSPKGAMGLMQLMPATARGLGVRDPFDPEENIAAGTRVLAERLKQYDGDLTLALAAYNAGSGNVRKYGGIPPFRETQNYIRRIFSLMEEER